MSLQAPAPRLNTSRTCPRGKPLDYAGCARTGAGGSARGVRGARQLPVRSIGKTHPVAAPLHRYGNVTRRLFYGLRKTSIRRPVPNHLPVFERRKVDGMTSQMTAGERLRTPLSQELTLTLESPHPLQHREVYGSDGYRAFYYLHEIGVNA